jgi:hypothetical protein
MRYSILSLARNALTGHAALAAPPGAIPPLQRANTTW